MQRQLEEEVGSYALMQGTGFEHKDMLLCCRFAEGDTVRANELATGP